MNATARDLPDRPLDWRTVCELAADGRFDGFSVELDEWGRILMTPVTFAHGAFAARIARLLAEALPDGTVVVEVGVRTRRGTRAPDVMWMSTARVAERESEYDDERAGEICVEVLSAGNHPQEIDEKRRLHFEQGACEVWICSVDGRMSFWSDATTRMEASRLASGFPLELSGG